MQYSVLQPKDMAFRHSKAQFGINIGLSSIRHWSIYPPSWEELRFCVLGFLSASKTLYLFIKADILALFIPVVSKRYVAPRVSIYRGLRCVSWSQRLPAFPGKG